MNVAIALADLVAIGLFILGLHFLNAPPTARLGNRLAAIGMLIALIGILVQTLGIGWWAIAIGVVIGATVGIVAALRVKMTAMPQMVALYNGAGGGAAALISTVEYYVYLSNGSAFDPVISTSLVLSAIIGCLSFAGSIIAFLKLQEVMTGRPITYAGQQIVNGIVALAIVAIGAWFIATAGGVPAWAFPLLLLAALILGVLFVLPIGGADMPVVISLLNSFTGVAVAITGFEIDSTLLIICGALVGASGTILTVDMGKAMNRPLTNVLFGAFGAAGGSEPAAGSGGPQNVRSVNADDVAVMLAYASKVMFVPGLRYGRRASAAQCQSARRPVGKARRKSVVRDPSGCGADAGTYERVAGRIKRAVRTASRYGRCQSGVSDNRRRTRHRSERRHEPSSPKRSKLADLRHADSRR